MANKEEDFIPYFKIKWSMTSTWTLEQAAYLSCGENPDSKKFNISVSATNIVSKRYYWHVNRKNKMDLVVAESTDSIDYFNAGSIARLWDEKKLPIDKEMKKTYDHMWQAPFGVSNIDSISRAVYREAGRLVFEQFPHATKPDVAKALEDLPKFFNSENHGHIKLLAPHQIEEYLKGLNQLSGKPKIDEKTKVVVDLAQLVENM